MKTWEMIKELTENPKKKFELIGDGSIVSLKLGFIVWESNLQSPKMNTFDEWEEVKQPVSFMEAMKAFEEGKKIHAIVDNNTFYFINKNCGFLSGVNVKEVLKGEWYID